MTRWRRPPATPPSPASARTTSFRCMKSIMKRFSKGTEMASEHVIPTGGVEKQPFIPYVDEKDCPASLKPVLDPYRKRMGFLPNALKLYMHRPEIAETLWKLNSNVMRDPSSTLDQLLKRKLAAVACAINGCAYCTAHSCAMLKKPKELGFEGWGVSEEELQDIIT